MSLLIFALQNITKVFYGGMASSVLILPFWYNAVVPTDQKEEHLYLFREYKIPVLQAGETSKKKITSTSDFAEVPQHTYSELIKGTELYNHGNYVMYIGSEFCPYCNNMLYGMKDIKGFGKNSNRTNDFVRSKWGKSYMYSNAGKNLKDLEGQVRFIMFSDNLPLSTSTKDKQVLPLAKWPDSVAADHSKGQAQNDYIRYDESAVNFRRIRNSLVNYFPESAVSHVPLVIAYKKGVPKIFGSDKFEEIEKRKVAKEKRDKKNEGNAKKQAESDAQAAAHNDLFEFIAYYYTHTVVKKPISTI